MFGIWFCGACKDAELECDKLVCVRALVPPSALNYDGDEEDPQVWLWGYYRGNDQGKGIGKCVFTRARCKMDSTYRRHLADITRAKAFAR